MKRLLSLGAFAIVLTIGQANAAEIFVRFGPPRPPREVVVVRPSPRHVWVPGYYNYAGGRYVWANGYWAVPPRRRAVWIPGRWVHRHHHGYVWVGGYWR